MRINALVAKAQKKPEEGWVMQDGTPWPGNNTRDHPGMIQVIVCAFKRKTNDSAENMTPHLFARLASLPT